MHRSVPLGVFFRLYFLNENMFVVGLPKRPLIRTWYNNVNCDLRETVHGERRAQLGHLTGRVPVNRKQIMVINGDEHKENDSKAYHSSKQWNVMV